MPVVTLNEEFVGSASCPADRNKVDFYDDQVTGFILEVRRTGGKTYHLKYRDDRGDQKQLKIGNTKDISFAKARAKAQQMRSRVVLGEDITGTRKRRRQIPKVSAVYQDVYLPFLNTYRRNLDSDLSFWNVHLLPRFGDYYLDQIAQQDVIVAHRELREAGYAAFTCNRAIIQLRYFYKVAKRAEVPGSESNPAVGVQLLEVSNGREIYLTQDETERLRVALEHGSNAQLKHIVALLLMLGCRKRELLDARWSEFDLERRSWRIPLSKNGKPRRVPLSLTVIELLKQLPRWPGCPFVVPNPDTKLPFGNLYYPWNKVRIEAGLPELRMHDLRHSFASNLVNSGRSIFEVQKILGHQHIKHTERYSHLSDEVLLSTADAAASAIGSGWTAPSQPAG